MKFVGVTMGPIVYRYRNVLNGTYLFTTSEEERNSLEEDPNFVAEGFEGQSFRAEIDPMTENQSFPTIPQEVFRFRRIDNGSFFYTISDQERDFVLNNPSVKDFYQEESESFFAYENSVAGSIPVFRFFNQSLGAHLYTPDIEERNSIIGTLNSPWEFEPGSTFYAFPLNDNMPSLKPGPEEPHEPGILVMGGNPEPGGEAAIEFNFEFEISILDVSGNLIMPKPQEAQFTFTFPEAIENFRGRFSDNDNNFGFEVINVTDRFASDDDPQPTIASPLTLDLTARYLPKDSSITLPDGESPDEFISGTEEVVDVDRIEYILTSKDFNDLGINEYTLILEDSDGDIENGFQVVVDDEGSVISDSNPDIEGFQRNFLDENGQEVEQTIDLSDDSIDIEGLKIIDIDFQGDAIRNIEHIVENGLLGLSTDTRVTGLSSVDSNTTFSIEDSLIVEPLPFVLIDPPTITPIDPPTITPIDPPTITPIDPPSFVLMDQPSFIPINTDI